MALTRLLLRRACSLPPSLARPELLRRRRQLSTFHLACGNSIRALHDAEECFPAMLNAIDSAQKEVLLEMYWFASDQTGYRFVDRLIEARKRAVDVRIVVDAFGCLETDSVMFQSLREAGCDVYAYNPLIGRVKYPSKLGVFLRRDHRKLLVVDGRLAITGGLNLAQHWLPFHEGGEAWRDVALSVEGPAAEAFAQVTSRMANVLDEDHDDHHLAENLRRLRQRGLPQISKTYMYTKEKFLHLLPSLHRGTKKLPPTSHAWWSAQGWLRKKLALRNDSQRVVRMKAEEEEEEEEEEEFEVPMLDKLIDSDLEAMRFSNVQLITNDAWGDRRSIRRGYIRAINTANKEVLIMNAYFLPDRSIRRALFRAVKRGVRVRVVVPGKSDHEMVRMVTQAWYKRLLNQGIELYEWSPSVLHSKVAVFDNEVAVVGTYNFDPVSFRSNLEIVAVVHDEAFSESLASRLDRDIAENCKQIQGNERSMDWHRQLGDLMVLAVERAVNIVLRRITNIS